MIAEAEVLQALLKVTKSQEAQARALDALSGEVRAAVVSMQEATTLGRACLLEAQSQAKVRQGWRLRAWGVAKTPIGVALGALAAWAALALASDPAPPKAEPPESVLLP